MSRLKNDKRPVIESGPIEPDPFWPGGAELLHLTPTEQQNKSIVASYAAVQGVIWECRKCGARSDPSKKDPGLCNTCSREEAQVSEMQKKVNSNWMDLAVELGLELFERQPEESDVEWRIWCAYRNYYPLKLPTHSQLAVDTNSSVATVVKATQKWSYKARLMAWARFTDADIQEKRIHAVRDMNSRQLTMTQTIQEKLEAALDALDPLILKPNEIVSLFKIATELERKVTTYVEEQVVSTAMESGTKQALVTKPEDLSEIIAILRSTGALEGKNIGIEQTTRLVVKEAD